MQAAAAQRTCCVAVAFSAVTPELVPKLLGFYSTEALRRKEVLTQPLLEAQPNKGQAMSDLNIQAMS